MAIKNQSPDADANAEQQPEVKAKELLDVGELRKKHKLSRAVFAGVCSVNGWKPGKAVTEEEFLKAIERFSGASIDGKHEEAKKESEAKK
jgi:hypothetical protein